MKMRLGADVAPKTKKLFSSVLHLGYVHVTIKSSMWQIWLTDEAEDVTNVGDEDDEQVG